MIVKADDYNSRTHTECDTITAFKREAYEITIHALIRSAIELLRLELLKQSITIHALIRSAISAICTSI